MDLEVLPTATTIRGALEAVHLPNVKDLAVTQALSIHMAQDMAIAITKLLPTMHHSKVLVRTLTHN